MWMGPIDFSGPGRPDLRRVATMKTSVGALSVNAFGALSLIFSALLEVQRRPREARLRVHDRERPVPVGLPVLHLHPPLPVLEDGAGLAAPELRRRRPHDKAANLRGLLR